MEPSLLCWTKETKSAIDCKVACQEWLLCPLVFLVFNLWKNGTISLLTALRSCAGPHVSCIVAPPKHCRFSQ
jgi:hypothetical protein